MQTLQRLVILLVISCPVPTVMGYSFDRNPDKRPSFGFKLKGEFDLHSTQELRSATGSAERDLNLHSLDFSMDLRFPLADAWTLQLGGGMTSQQTAVDEFSILPASSVDELTAGGHMSLRYYFVDHSIFEESPARNPDRWPSIGLNLAGAANIYHDDIDILFGFPGLSPKGDIQHYAAGGDLRLPLRDEWTLLLSLTGSQVISNADETPAAPGNVIRLELLTYGGGLRHYFVGHNLIAKDQKVNPDRWSSLSLEASGLLSVGGHQTVTDRGAVGKRDFSASGFGLTSELRLPLTNYLTFQIGAGGGISYQYLPFTPSFPIGSFSTIPVINSFAAFRHYFR